MRYEIWTAPGPYSFGYADRYRRWKEPFNEVLQEARAMIEDGERRGIKYREQENIGTYHCDWKGKCHRPPYREIYPYAKDGSDIVNCEWGWSYLCFWHFHFARIYAVLGLRNPFRWAMAEKNGEVEEE